MGTKLDTEIIGVAKDAKYSEVKAAIPALFFRPYKQGGARRVDDLLRARPATDPEAASSARFSQSSAAASIRTCRSKNLRTLPQQVKENVFMDRFIGVMSTSFAVLATLLAAVGLYGVLAYTVAQRTREIGLRMALGAAPARVRLMILRQVAVMTVIGGGSACWLRSGSRASQSRSCSRCRAAIRWCSPGDHHARARRTCSPASSRHIAPRRSIR